jgi:hypothetical protein
VGNELPAIGFMCYLMSRGNLLTIKDMGWEGGYGVKGKGKRRNKVFFLGHKPFLDI